MSFLIGSILMLAGAQLIFPSKNTAKRAIIAKINAPVKTPATADLSRFAANGLAPSADNSADNSSDAHRQDGNLNATPSFVLRSELSTEMRTGAETKLESIPEKIQTTASVKLIPSAEQNTSPKSTAPPAAGELNDNSLSGQMSYEDQ